MRRRTTTATLVFALASGLAGCGSNGGSGSTTTEVSSLPKFTNKCEEDVNAALAESILDNSIEPVYAKWGKDTVLGPMFQAIYDELDPAFGAGQVAIAVQYMGAYAINVCTDNDVYNLVLGLGEDDAGYRDGCLDGKLPDVNEALTGCTEGNQATTTTTG